MKVEGVVLRLLLVPHGPLSSVIVTTSTVLCCHPVFTPRVRQSTTSPRQIASIFACKENKATRVRVSFHPSPKRQSLHKHPATLPADRGLRSVWLLRRVICSIFDLLAVSVLSAGLKYDSISEGKVNRTVLGRRREGQPPPHPNCKNTNTNTHKGNKTAQWEPASERLNQRDLKSSRIALAGLRSRNRLARFAMIVCSEFSCRVEAKWRLSAATQVLCPRDCLLNETVSYFCQQVVLQSPHRAPRSY